MREEEVARKWERKKERWGKEKEDREKMRKKRERRKQVGQQPFNEMYINYAFLALIA